MHSVPIFTLNLGNDWQISANDVTRITHDFWLDPLDICVGYWLHIERAPAGTAIYINDQAIGGIENSAPFSSDATNFVWLEKNTITFEVTHPLQDGQFPLNGVRFEAIPCE